MAAKKKFVIEAEKLGNEEINALLEKYSAADKSEKESIELEIKEKVAALSENTPKNDSVNTPETPKEKTKVTTKEDPNGTCYAFCCIHGGIRIQYLDDNKKSQTLHLKSANSLKVSNGFMNIQLNPNSYSVTKVTNSVKNCIKEQHASAKWLKGLFVFFHSSATLTDEQLNSILNKRGPSPYEQLTEKEIESATGVKASSQDD